MMTFLGKIIRPLAFVIVAVAVLAGLAVATGQVPAPWTTKKTDEPMRVEASRLGVELVPDMPHTLSVPEDVRKALGIRKGTKEQIAVAALPTHGHPLVMPGSTMLDTALLTRIRARFAPSPSSAEVVEIGQVAEDPAQSGKPETTFRELRSGDRVKKGDLLAVFKSVDVGGKKNDLLDALYQLKLDEDILKSAEAKVASLPEAFLWTARRNVRGDINAVNRAVNMLKTWGISDEDIKAVRDEAEKVKKDNEKPKKDLDELWARVEIRAPEDGIIVERNLALHEIIVDNTTNLFQIAKINRLTVIANIPEDDQPTLHKLPTSQRRWTVQTVGSAPIKGVIDDIGVLIDPNQHTAVVKGHIDNPGEILRAGQFITATVELPPPPDVVEVPVDAVVDDGQQSVVFIVTDEAKHYYTMRRVELTQRFDNTVFVRSKPFTKEEELTPEEAELGLLPKKPLHPGDRILKTGVGELKTALLDKEDSQPTKEKEKAN
jgi:cobalt-zinc-cadmium efflux system membrane fusion protein